MSDHKAPDIMAYLQRKIAVALVVLLLCAAMSTPAWAQNQTSSYVIGSDDILTITIFAGGKKQEEVDVVVSPSGTVNFPFLGRVRARGYTIAALEDRVTNPLATDYFVNPQVNIQVKEIKSKKVYITGAVTNPGLYPLEHEMTLLELIAKSGGVTKDRGNRAFILKGSLSSISDKNQVDKLVKQRKSLQVDLKKLLDEGNYQGNINLTAGDVIYIQPSTYSNAAQLKVFVLGKVNNPGAFPYQEGLTALDACTLAGGFAKYADPSQTVITRRSQDGSQKTVKVNLDLVKNGETRDEPLEAGDRVFVPKSWF